MLVTLAYHHNIEKVGFGKSRHWNQFEERKCRPSYFNIFNSFLIFILICSLTRLRHTVQMDTSTALAWRMGHELLAAPKSKFRHTDTKSKSGTMESFFAAGVWFRKTLHSRRKNVFKVLVYQLLPLPILLSDIVRSYVGCLRSSPTLRLQQKYAGEWCVHYGLSTKVKNSGR